MSDSQLPLDGVRVIELGQLISGPYCAKILAEFGAEVIKVEPPGSGDPLRNWRELHNGTSLWWHAQSRNKQSIAVDLRESDGQELIRRLAEEADVLIENFRPGRMEEWGLGYDVLTKGNPGLLMLRISGYGQTGPYRDRPGFGVIGEAMGGLRHLTATPGHMPVRVGISIGDSLAGLHGVIGVLIALYHRMAHGGRGQVIDVALYESVFSVMESLLPEYDVNGSVRPPAGSALPGIAPSNAYRCQDGIVLIAGNGDGIFHRLMSHIGRSDLANDPLLKDNAGRVRRVNEIDSVINEWTVQRTVDQVLSTMEKAHVPAGKVYTAADIAHDPQYQAREMILRQETYDGLDLAVPGVVPKLTGTPGAVRNRAPRVGEHTERVLRKLGISNERIRTLRSKRVIQ